MTSKDKIQALKMGEMVKDIGTKLAKEEQDEILERYGLTDLNKKQIQGVADLIRDVQNHGRRRNRRGEIEMSELRFKGVCIDVGTEKELIKKRKKYLSNKSFILMKPNRDTGKPELTYMGTKKKFMTFPQFKEEDFTITGKVPK